jgi:hypothetical protein
MAIPMPPNVSVDIYHSANPASPYPSGTPAVSGVTGYLQPRVQTGRHGTASYLKWTHIFYCSADVDVRDAYNSQLGTYDNTKADTLVINDLTDLTKKTAFYVVYVELANGILRVYLDRFQPVTWPTTAL